MITSEPEQIPIRRAPSTMGLQFVLGTLLTTTGAVLTGFCPTHSLAHKCGMVAIATGALLKLYKTDYLLATLIMCVGLILGLLFGFQRIPTVVILSLVVLALIYGWWKERQTKALAKRQTHRP